MKRLLITVVFAISISSCEKEICGDGFIGSWQIVNKDCSSIESDLIIIDKNEEPGQIVAKFDNETVTMTIDGNEARKLDGTLLLHYIHNMTLECNTIRYRQTTSLIFVPLNCEMTLKRLE